MITRTYIRTYTKVLNTIQMYRYVYAVEKMRKRITAINIK